MANNIYLFNPTCELAVANNTPNFTPPAHLLKFENDLSFLVAYVAQPSDTVLVNNPIPEHFIKQLSNLDFNLPQILSFENLFLKCLKSEIYIDRIIPWGWSKATHKYFSVLKPFCSSSYQNSAVANWQELHRELYSRQSGIDILSSFLEVYQFDWLPSITEIPQICTNHNEIISIQKKWEKVVVKSPFSSSGRGLQVLREGEYNRSNREVISGMLRQQGFVTVGKWYNKLIDISFQFFSDGNGEVSYVGATTFTTDHLGRFVGINIEELPTEIDKRVRDFILEKKEFVAERLKKNLVNSKYSTHYYGWLGCDAIIYEDEFGCLKFHPCIEINCRYTMGAIALSLRQKIAPNSAAKMLIYSKLDKTFSQFCSEMMAQFPLEIADSKIVSGFLPLTPFSESYSFGAYITVNSVILSSK